MKWMIASDLHGSVRYGEKLFSAMDREKVQRLILLGDLLYHGPRNHLPDEYDTQRAAALLNARKDEILCVRGNCDSEVDQMMLEFPILAEYAVLPVGEHLMYLTHGHQYNEEHPLPMQTGDVLMNGHFHVPCCREHETFVYMNPGSVSLPKAGSPRGYILLEENRFLWKTLEGTVFQEYVLP